MFDNRMTVAEYFGYNTPDETVAHPKVLTNDAVGVEVELEDCKPLVRADEGLWVITKDGSLRGDYGYEYRFNGPLAGNNIIAALENLEACFSPKKLPTVSNRCSVHVHVDVRDMTKDQLMQMILLYMIWEQPVFRTYAPGRWDNHFCLPFNGCIDLVPAVQWLHAGWPEFSKHINAPEVGRYCAFNLRSIMKFGSVEFRHHGGAFKADEILRWINVCLAFKRMSLTPVNLREEFFQASQAGFDKQLDQYFPRDVVASINQHYRDNEPEGKLHWDIVDGIRRAQAASCPKIKI